MGFYGLERFGTFGLVGLIVKGVISLLFLVGLVWFIVWAIKQGRKTASLYAAAAGPVEPSAKEIAQARYAKGEINRDEYQQILNDLKG